jgi:hypothetical protein
MKMISPGELTFVACFDPCGHTLGGNLRHAALNLGRDRRRSCDPKSQRPPLRLPRVALGKGGLLGRHVGCGGGHVSGAILWDLHVMLSRCLSGASGPRWSRLTSGVTVAQGGDIRPRHRDPFMDRPNTQARRANACIRQPVVRVGRRSMFVTRAGADMSQPAGSTRRTNADR